MIFSYICSDAGFGYDMIGDSFPAVETILLFVTSA